MMDLTALEELDDLDPKACEVLTSVLELHREALSRIVDRDRALELVKDELVASVLLLHGLHPIPVRERVRAAIDASGVRAELLEDMRIAFHSGDVHDLESALLARAPDADVRIERTALLAPSTLVRPKPAAEGVDACEGCGTPLDDRHTHLVRGKEMRCVCPSCSSAPGWRAVDRRVSPCALALDDATWDALGIPIGLAFFVARSDRVVAMYPSPAGATESMLPLDAWHGFTQQNPSLVLAPEVEALLVRRTNGKSEQWLVSIDLCHALVGRIRKRWRGFTGGAELWQDVDAFFSELREEAAHA